MPRLLALSISLMACTGVRPMQRPAQSVRLTVVRAAPPLREDCDVRVVDGQCGLRADPSGRANFEVACKSAPPASGAVASANVCDWGGAEMAELRRRACAAGGDTIMLNYSLTDSCFRETFESLSGTSVSHYTIYRHDDRR